MSLATSEAPQAGTKIPNSLLRTETRVSLYTLGVSENAPPVDYNYPDVGRATEPLFPEEYTLETATGLVPEETIERIRSGASRATTRRRRNSAYAATTEDTERDLELLTL
jgi:hypothetical protein